MSDRLTPLRWLAPPDGDGRGVALAAATAHAIGWMIVACGLFGLAASAVFLGLSTARVAACAGTVALGAGAIALVRSGRVGLAGLLVVGGSFAIVALGALHEGHVLAPSNMGFFAVVAMAGLTLGGWGGFATAGASIAFLAALGRWPQLGPAPPIDPGTAIVAQGTMLMVLAVLLHFARGRIDRALTAADARQREFEARNRELESERERFQVISESSQHLITEIDLQGNVLYASPNHSEVMGWKPEELIGREWHKLIQPEALAHADVSREVKAGAGEIPPTTYRVQHRDGSVLWLESAGRAFTAADGGTRLVSVTRDVTRRVALESQLRQSQKLEAVGRLAGGVAHDFNNLLTVINLHSEILLEDERFGDTPALRDIHAAGERAQSLTRQLLAFSRRQALRPRILDLTQALRGVESLLLRLLGRHITLSFRPSPEPLYVVIDPTELEQVVVNLAVNARDAMPEGGRIEIATRPEARRPDPASDKKESWAVLEVRDEGEGMSADVLSRLFEPFFTTKEVGEGTGLGLAVVHGIIEQSGGHVEVESEPGLGTCFRIYLRRLDATEPEKPAAPSEEPKTAGLETILLVEDDPAVRSLVCSILGQGGYRVIEAANGLEALSVLQSSEESVDLLLTDVVMREMGGRALRLQLAEIRPGLPAIFMSGYPEPDRNEATRGPLPGDRLISKPFTRRELLSTVRSVLDGEAPSATH